MAYGGPSSSLDIAKEAVDSIVKHIEASYDALRGSYICNNYCIQRKFTKFNVSDIIKGGSLGHGTAVLGHYDIDLVIYSRDISAEAVYYENGFKKWIDMLKVFVKEQFDPNAETPGQNYRLVHFTFPHEKVTLPVDLLVSPYWNRPEEFYNFLRRIPKESRNMFTVCASRWQVEFFKKLHVEEQVIKEYIRRAKAWRNNNWNEGSVGRPKSYLMSLLVVKAYEMAPQKRPIDITRALKQLVINYHSIDVYWDGYYYNRADYSDLLPSRPRLIDPANPANNVWETGIYGPSRELVSKINTIDLSQPVRQD